MTIQLEEQWAELVHRKMQNEGYESAEAVVEEAMRLLRDREATELERLRQAIAVGMADIEAGHVYPFDDALIEDIKARGRLRLAAIEEVRSA